MVMANVCVRVCAHLWCSVVWCGVVWCVILPSVHVFGVTVWFALLY